MRNAKTRLKVRDAKGKHFFTYKSIHTVPQSDGSQVILFLFLKVCHTCMVASADLDNKFLPQYYHNMFHSLVTYIRKIII